jgi:hypothetical protein
VSAADEVTVTAYRAAYDAMLGFAGDPIALVDAVGDDEAFVAGPVFALVYRLLGGASPTEAAVEDDVARLQARRHRVDRREAGHVDAALALHAGDFLTAAGRWDAITLDHPQDFAAYRYAHDVCLHIGDDTLRMPSAERPVAAWPAGTRAHGLAAGLLSFALEEVGRFGEAEHQGATAIEHDPDDLWARHALAHVYESTGDHAASVALLGDGQRWGAQDLLSNHVWWHVGLRLLHHGDTGGAIDLLDQRLRSRTSFGLADAGSLLWRAQLAGADPGDRWRELADAWAADPHRHTCGFLDLHAALAFAAVPGHPDAETFWTGVEMAYEGAVTYNALTFRGTVRPLVRGIRAFGAGDHATAADLLGSVAPTLPRVGGSVVQRDLVARTFAVARERAGAR